MDELENPFRPGAGTSPPALIGRDTYIDAFGVTMRRALGGRPGKSVMPIGLRGVGKTVLLNRFGEIAETEGARQVFIEASEHDEFSMLLAGRLRRLLLQLDRESKSAKVLRALRVLKAFTATLPDGTQVQLDVEAMTGDADSGIIADDLTDLLEAVGEAVQERGTCLLISVDEVQYLARDEFAGLISAIHRTTQRDLPVVLVGAGLPQLPGIAGTAKSYAERLFDFPEMGPLDLGGEAQAVLQLPAAALGASFSEVALEAIVQQARGYPYFLQEWGYHCWNVADGPVVTVDDVRAAEPRVTRQLDDNFFRVRLDRLTPSEKRYLHGMARLGAGPHRSGDIAAELGVRVESVAPRRSQLIVKGMVWSPAHGDTAFTVPLFDEFLRRDADGRRPSG